MPAHNSDREKRASRTRVRVVKSTTASKTTRTRAKKASSRKAPQRASVPKNDKVASQKRVRAANKISQDALQWNDLIEAENLLANDKTEDHSFLGAISTLRFTLGVLAIACVFTLYVGHVYATQDLLAEVQQARRDNLSLRLQFNRTKGLYDAATGPAIIYQRAHALGLEERQVSGPPIRIIRE